MLQVLRLRRKGITRRRTSADLYEGAPSAAPATQNEPEVFQVLRLPRKPGRKSGDVPSAAPATQNERCKTAAAADLLA